MTHDRTDNRAYCADLARSLHPDRYLAGMLAPPAVRARALALTAFDAELVRIQAGIGEEGLIAIRFQWWREALEGIAAGQPRQHPVVLAIASDAPDSLDVLGELIDAREHETARAEWPTFEALAETTAATDGLLSSAISADGGGESDGIVSRGWGLAIRWTALAPAARRRRCLVPIEMLRARDARAADLLELRRTAPLRLAMDDLRQRIGQEIATAAGQPMAPSARPVLLLRRIARARLEATPDPLAPGSGLSSLRRAVVAGIGIAVGRS